MFSWLSFSNFSPSPSSLFLNATNNASSTDTIIHEPIPEEGDIFIIVTDIEDNEETDTESIVSSTTTTCTCSSCANDSSSSSCPSTSLTLKRDLKTGFRDWQLVLKLPPTKPSLSSHNSFHSSSSSSANSLVSTSTSSLPGSPSFGSSSLYPNNHEDLKPHSYLLEPAWSPTLCSKLSFIPTKNGFHSSTSSVPSSPTPSSSTSLSSSSSSSSSSLTFSFSSPPPSPSLIPPSLTLLEVLKSQERQHYHHEWLLKKYLRNSIPSSSSSNFSSSSHTPGLTSNKCLLSLSHTSNLKKQKKKIEKWRSRLNGPHYQRSK